MNAQRTIAILLLLVAGIFSLPVVAYFFDDPGTENWIIPIQLALMAGLGALVGRLLPGLAGTNRSSRPAVVGAVIGIVMAVIGIVIFFLLLNGISGA
jgi:hypothetical protein